MLAKVSHPIKALTSFKLLFYHKKILFVTLNDIQSGQFKVNVKILKYYYWRLKRCTIVIIQTKNEILQISRSLKQEESNFMHIIIMQKSVSNWWATIGNTSASLSSNYDSKWSIYLKKKLRLIALRWKKVHRKRRRFLKKLHKFKINF